MGLQRAHLVRERALGQVDLRGGLREPPGVGDRRERAQVADLDQGRLLVI